MCENEPNFDSNIFELKSRRRQSLSARRESEQMQHEQRWIQEQNRRWCGQVLTASDEDIQSKQCANSAAPRPLKSCHDWEVVHRFPKTDIKSDFCVVCQASTPKTGLLSRVRGEKPSMYVSGWQQSACKGPPQSSAILTSGRCLSLGAVFPSQYFDAQWDGGIPPPPIQVETGL